jgi:hypothetical protein
METREYKLNFGIVKVSIDGNTCTGAYQNNGTFSGTINGDFVKAKWSNEDQEGLIELDLSDDKLVGKWKQGIDDGPMRGKWNGILVKDAGLENKSTKTYNLIIHATSSDSEKEVTPSIYACISKWFASIGGIYSTVIENKVFNTESYDSFCEFFIPVEGDLSKLIPSLILALNTAEDCDYWIYTHKSINTKDIIMGDSPNYDLESEDNIFISPSDPSANQGEGAYASLFSSPSEDKIQVESNEANTTQEYETSESFLKNEEYNSLIIATNPPSDWLSIFWTYVTDCLDEDECDPSKAVILKYAEDEEDTVHGVYFYVDGGSHRVASNVRELSEELNLWIKYTDLENINVDGININDVSEDDMDINWDNYVFIDSGTIDEGEGMIFDWFED